MPAGSLVLPLAGALLAAAQSVPAEPPQPWRNLTAGGVLRPGIYGRIEVRGARPPPVIHSRPVVGSGRLVPPHARPVYLYVPPGQVRKWQRHCAKWRACDQPVLFVRVDKSPSRWGQWRRLREQFGAQEP